MKEFRTKNLNAAAAMISWGADFVNVEFTPDKNFDFIFYDPVRCETFMNRFLSGDDVPVQVFLENREYLLRKIKPKKQ